MRDSFIFYRSFYEAINGLPTEDQLILYQSIANYVLNGKKPSLTGTAKSVFTLIKPQLDANNARYKNGQKGAQYGKLGGRPKKPLDNPKGVLPVNPNQTPNVNENVNENENVNGATSGQKPSIKDFKKPIYNDNRKIIGWEK